MSDWANVFLGVIACRQPTGIRPGEKVSAYKRLAVQLPADVRLKLQAAAIAPTTTSIGTGPVTCRARLGGVLKFYYREAA